jgi:hypothetical protein
MCLGSHLNKIGSYTLILVPHRYRPTYDSTIQQRRSLVPTSNSNYSNIHKSSSGNNYSNAHVLASSSDTAFDNYDDSLPFTIESNEQQHNASIEQLFRNSNNYRSDGNINDDDDDGDDDDDDVRGNSYIQHKYNKQVMFVVLGI